MSTTSSRQASQTNSLIQAPRRDCVRAPGCLSEALLLFPSESCPAMHCRATRKFCFLSLRILQTISTAAAPIYNPTNGAQGCFSSPTRVFSDTSHPSRWEVASHCGSELHSLVTSDLENLFMVLLATGCLLSDNVCLVPLPTFHRITCFCYWVARVLYMYWILAPSQMRFANISPRCPGCLFTGLMVPFALRKLLRWE